MASLQKAEHNRDTKGVLVFQKRCSVSHIWKRQL
jgi:hypothetical protein